jgi:hypothetical protein
MYDFGFWSLKGPLLLPLRRSLPPPLGGSLPPLPKGLPPPLFIDTFFPLVGSPPPSQIRDGLPFRSWYGFLVGIVHGILGLRFLLDKSSSSFKGSP